MAIFVASRPAWTGIGLHEWLAGLLVLPALYHLAINWDWVLNSVPRLIHKLRTASRVDFAIDVLLFLGLVAVTVTGFMLIPGVLGIGTPEPVVGVWLRAHQIASDVTIIAMIAHFATHARWMSDTFSARGYVPPPGRHAEGRPSRPGQPVRRHGRR